MSSVQQMKTAVELPPPQAPAHASPRRSRDISERSRDISGCWRNLSRRWRGIPAWLVSANVHLILLLFLATWMTGETDPPVELALVVSVDDDAEIDPGELTLQIDVALLPETLEKEPLSSEELLILPNDEPAALPETLPQAEPRQSSFAADLGLGSRSGSGGGMALAGAAIGSPKRAALRYEQLRVAVTDWKYDDIPEVLTALGISYRHVRESKTPLQDFDVIFVGCGGGLSRSVASPSELRAFVERGGVLYVSDLSGEMLHQAFGEEFGKKMYGPKSRHTTCLVMDKDLKSVLGTRVRIYFDLPGWLYFPKPSSQVEVMVRLGSRSGHPLVLRLHHGKGRVLFTSFHNHANISAAERQLVRSLVTELPY